MNRRDVLKKGGLGALLSLAGISLFEGRQAKAADDYIGTYCTQRSWQQAVCASVGVERRWYDLYQKCSASGCSTYRVYRTNWHCGWCP